MTQCARGWKSTPYLGRLSGCRRARLLPHLFSTVAGVWLPRKLPPRQLFGAVGRRPLLLHLSGIFPCHTIGAWSGRNLPPQWLHSWAAGRCPGSCISQGFPLSIPAACGWDDVYHHSSPTQAVSGRRPDNPASLLASAGKARGWDKISTSDCRL